MMLASTTVSLVKGTTLYKDILNAINWASRQDTQNGVSFGLLFCHTTLHPCNATSPGRFAHGSLGSLFPMCNSYHLYNYVVVSIGYSKQRVHDAQPTMNRFYVNIETLFWSVFCFVMFLS